MRCNRTCLAVVGTGALLFVWASAAPALAASRSRAVVDLTGADDEATVMRRLQESFGVGFHADLLPLDTVTDTGTGPWHASPPGRLEPCSATAPLAAEDVDALLADAEARIDDLEHEAARELLDALDAGLCASVEPLDPADILRIPLLRGIAEFYAGDREAARSSFRRAAALVDKLEWDTGFSPEAQQVFLLGVGDAVQASRATLHVSGGERPDEIWVDGHSVSSGDVEFAVSEGRHLIQFREAGGPLVGAELTVDAVGRICLLGPEALRQGLSSAPDDEGAPSYAVVAVGAAEHGYTEVVVIDDAAWDRCWWFNVIDGVWKPISLTAGARLRAARAHKTVGGVLAGGGVALAVGGGVLAISQASAMADLKPQMEANASSHAAHVDEYEVHRTSAAMGIGLFAAGTATLTAGLLLAARGQAIQEETAVDPRLTLVVTPQGAWFALGGSF